MKLKQWLSQTQVSRSEFAKRLGVSKSVVTKWCNGEVMPRSIPLIAIYRITGGLVSPNDFYNLAGLVASNDADSDKGRCAGADDGASAAA
ncbi:helix-turn-helix transcriptional regulator [Thalassospira sp. MCCC 1A01428]|uniref:helix-turn-helix domain-containing protein n=1 Tax=Thalassospira sp. MCCC 1A01428 TaxID=1470575 RepID=UPI000A1F1840|nr:helix-turn-helix transcriptional regulator [Thalassospira sp. MCCC 1A01428]